MKTKSISQMADLSIALDYLALARSKASAGGEATLAAMIGNLAQKIELAALNAKTNERKA